MTSIRERLYRGLFGLQFRTTALLTGIVLAATGLTGATYLRMATQMLVEGARSDARDLAGTLAVSSAAAMQAEDREGLLGIASEVVREGELNYVIFADMTGRMLAGFQKGAGSINHLLLNDNGFISVEPLDNPRLQRHGDQDSTIDIVLPVQGTTTKGSNSETRPTIGYVRLGLGLASSEVRLRAMVRSVIGMAISIALLMVPIGFAVVRYIAAPIERLSSAAKQFAAGRLEARVSVDRRDEIGELSQSFNSMADELTQSHNQLVKLNAELEDRVVQRTTALENANRLLREMASRDPLTGLYNRRHFNDLLAQLFAESNRYGTELTCMMIDLDNFKQVNDSLGHQSGDRLLQLTADVINSSIRESDVAVRYGGDEFAVLLPQTSPAEARHSAERILKNFRDRIGREFPAATIASLSIGMISRERNQPATATELINLSDEALYHAKAGGKNRITVARPTAAVA